MAAIIEKRYIYNYVCFSIFLRCICIASGIAINVTRLAESKYPKKNLRVMKKRAERERERVVDGVREGNKCLPSLTEQ